MIQPKAFVLTSRSEDDKVFSVSRLRGGGAGGGGGSHRDSGKESVNISKTQMAADPRIELNKA